jgi:hypothetical protein
VRACALRCACTSECAYLCSNSYLQALDADEPQRERKQVERNADFLDERLEVVPVVLCATRCSPPLCYGSWPCRKRQSHWDGLLDNWCGGKRFTGSNPLNRVWADPVARESAKETSRSGAITTAGNMTGRPHRHCMYDCLTTPYLQGTVA